MKLALVCFKYGVDISDPCCFPLGLMYISAVLKRAGHDVTVINQNIESRHISVKDYDAILMTGFEEFLPQIKTLGAVCRLAGVKTILGGALATFKPQEMLQYVDTVVVGEGEDVICRALTTTGMVQGTKPDLDTLPLPDYEGFGIEEYHKRHPFRYMGVLTSRGCPHSCTFCSHTCSFQYRSLENVFSEIEFYKEKYGISTVVFNDNTLNVSKKRFLQICAEMGRLKLSWSAAIRVDRFDDEMAAAAKFGGANYFVVGVESFNQAKLDHMNKKATVQQICRTLDLLHKYKIDYHGNVLFGFPGETYASIVAEVQSIPKGYNVFPVMVRPFVGTTAGASTLTQGEWQHLDSCFKEYIHSRGKYCYPDLEVAA